MPINRIDKVNSLLEHEIGKIIQKDFDFPINTLTTLICVKTTSNLIESRVFISVFPDNRGKEVVDGLNRSVYSIQKKINKLLNMRPVPRIKFYLDLTQKTAGKVEELLAELKNQEK